ncbi:MAG: hypothetical protein GY827_04885 [Cytophagales bacterium]|nr:hypothetical protein [Cytophagales bacterium]
MSKESLIAKYNQHKGEMVLLGYRVYQLIGLVDAYDDYYWVLQDGRKLKYSTCVGSFAPLKNKLDDKDYNELIRIAKLNWFSCENSIGDIGALEYQIEMENSIHDEKLADFCWNLN